MFFRIVMVCLLLAAGYVTCEIVRVGQHYRSLQNPPADFMVLTQGNSSGPVIVEFMNYDCQYCRDTHLVLSDYAAKNPSVRHVVRPVPYASGVAEKAAEMVLAAGLQGKFADLNRAITDYKGGLHDSFYRETAALLDIDYDRMVLDSETPEIKEWANENANASLRAKLKKTPAFMINKTIYELDKPLTLADLTRMLQAEQNK